MSNRPLLPESSLAPHVREQIQSYHRNVVDAVVAAIARDPVVVVGMAQNPFVKKARRALETAGVPFTYLEYGSYLSPPEDWEREPADGRALLFARRVRCPALVIHGDDDHISRWAVGERLARELHAPVLTIAGGGHAPQARWPVLVDRAIRDFVRGLEVSP